MELLRELADTRAPLTTAELCERLGAAATAPPMVNEVVYRNLLVLERRGAVVRLPRNGRHTSWVVQA